MFALEDSGFGDQMRARLDSLSRPLLGRYMSYHVANGHFPTDEMSKVLKFNLHLHLSVHFKNSNAETN